MSTNPNIFTQPFGVTWRKALLSAPRLVPDVVLKYTSPLGPHPIVVNLPSRGSHLIPIYIFIPSQQRNSDNTKQVPPSPTNLSSPNIPAKLPVLVDFHGGGFIFGSCQEQAPFCAFMARSLNAIAISVDYRLGPAAKFPAATEDAEDVVNAIMKPSAAGYAELRSSIAAFLTREKRGPIEIDSTKIAISGFSSGGNLALSLGLNVRKGTSPHTLSSDWPSAFPVDHATQIPLLLFYPSLDARQLPDERPLPASMAAQKPGLVKSLRLEAELMPTYLPRDQAAHPRASPGLVDMRDGGLHERARVLLVLPELDTLAAQSEIWVQKVRDEGREDDLLVRRQNGVVHGWTQFPDSWLDDAGRRVKVEVFELAKELVAKAWRGDKWKET